MEVVWCGGLSVAVNPVFGLSESKGPPKKTTLNSRILVQSFLGRHES